MTTVDITPKNDAQDVHKVDVSLINQPLDTGEECNTFISIDTKDKVVVDVGVLLVGCENHDGQECRKDETSSLGGRCTTTRTSYKDTSAIQRTRQTISKPRFLQETEGLECPANCPQSFCGCIEAFSDFDIKKDPTCATEIKSVCSNEVITNCVVTDAEYSYSISDYCPYLTCIIDTYAEGIPCNNQVNDSSIGGVDTKFSLSHNMFEKVFRHLSSISIVQALPHYNNYTTTIIFKSYYIY